MSKQELINAIQATITANGQKGITAESLANILIEMVNTAGEGGSGGGAETLVIKASVVEVGDEGIFITSNDSDKIHNATVVAECAKLLAEGKAASIAIDVVNVFADMGLVLDSGYDVATTVVYITGANAEASGLPDGSIGTFGYMVSNATIYPDGTIEGQVNMSF